MERQRGTRQQRGYGSAHDQARKVAAEAVALGLVICWRCGERIQPSDEWDLGHSDGGALAGPEHAGRCNRRAAALKGHGKDWTPEPGRNRPAAAAAAPLSADLSLARLRAQERADRAAERRRTRQAKRDRA